MKVIILGANGMLGHVVSTYFREHGHEIIATTRDKSSRYYYDAFENVYAIEDIIKTTHPDAVINCIGILNQVAEDNHALAIMVNGFLPNYLDLLSAKHHFKFVHITTDCVFNGDKGNYTEDSITDAISYYGRSKAMGEVNNDRTLTLRLSIVGPDINAKGIGLFQWFSNQNDIATGYSEVFWTGITTIELARIIEEGITKNLSGLHHVVNNAQITKADLLRLFEKYFHFGITIQNDSSVKSRKTLIRTAKSYDFNIPSYDTMIKNMRIWVDAHPNLYQNLIKRIN